MLLQAVIGACLETPEYFNIGPLDLPIALWMCNRSGRRGLCYTLETLYW
jgi:hypothetical protein